MSTFDLSLAAKPEAASAVKASDQYTKVKDPKTGQMERQTITDGAVTINKAGAPKLKIDGPLGHMYTELLNRELSLESMGAIVAAADEAMDTEVDTNATPGMVAVSNGLASIEQPNNDLGYVYIFKVGSLESQALGEISKKMINHRLSNPKANIGLGAITDGKTTASLESLIRCVQPMGVRVAFTETGALSMLRDYLKG
jgi:hypothetical protein